MDGFDMRMPVHVGWAYSSMLRAQALSIGFDGDVRVLSLGERLELRAVLSLDGLNSRPTEQLGRERSPFRYFGVGVGPGLLWRIGLPGPAIELSVVPQALAFENAFNGYGAGARLDAFPFYLPMDELPGCRYGKAVTYVLSGVSVFVLGREDHLKGIEGGTYAVGLSLDYGRSVIAPLVGLAAGRGLCDAPGGR